MVVVSLGIAVVTRANLMRETELQAEQLHGLRDSLSVVNLEYRLLLSKLCSPDRIYEVLQDSCFFPPSSLSLRFIMFDGSVPWSGGVLTRRLAFRLPPAWRGISMDSPPRGFSGTRIAGTDVNETIQGSVSRGY